MKWLLDLTIVVITQLSPATPHNLNNICGLLLVFHLVIHQWKFPLPSCTIYWVKMRWSSFHFYSYSSPSSLFFDLIFVTNKLYKFFAWNHFVRFSSERVRQRLMMRALWWEHEAEVISLIFREKLENKFFPELWTKIYIVDNLFPVICLQWKYSIWSCTEYMGWSLYLSLLTLYTIMHKENFRNQNYVFMTHTAHFHLFYLGNLVNVSENMYLNMDIVDFHAFFFFFQFQGEPGFFLAHQLIRRALGIPRATVHWYDKPG